MTTVSNQKAVIFYEKRLTGTLLKRSVDEVSMTYHSIVYNKDDLSTHYIQDYPPVTIIGCEHIGERVNSLIHSIRSIDPQTHIILCWTQTSVPSIQLLRPFLETTDPDTFCHSSELITCLQNWQKGLAFVSNYYRIDISEQPRNSLPGWDELTDAEQRILELLVEGLSVSEITEVLSITKSTINNHKANIAQKLNVRGGPGSFIRFVVNNHKLLTLLFNK